MAAPVTVSEVKLVIAPTAPVIVTVPPLPPVNVKACMPLIVLEKEIFAPDDVPPLFVVSTVIDIGGITTGPVIVTIPPLVVKLPFKLIAVEPL